MLVTICLVTLESTDNARLDVVTLLQISDNAKARFRLMTNRH